MLVFWLVCVLALISVGEAARRKIYDPLFVFCGEDNCYELLGFPVDSVGINETVGDRAILKAYRRLSQKYHPDKNRDANATEIFRRVSKAKEVLENNKTRDSFHYYLRTKDYFKVSGEYYYRALPKASVTNVLLGVLLLMSAFLHVAQKSKHERAKRFLLDRVSRGANEMTGGTKQTMDLFAQAQDKYLRQLEAQALGAATAGGAGAGAGAGAGGGAGGGGGADAAGSSSPKGASAGAGAGGLTKLERKQAAKLEAKLAKGGGVFKWAPQMLREKEFQDIAKKLIDETKIEGDYAKPELKDLFVLRVLRLPYSLLQYGAKYHRRYISSAPLSAEEKTEMAIEAVGPATWDELTPAQQANCIEIGVWRSSVYDEWLKDRYKTDKKLRKRMEAEGDGEDLHFD